MVLGNASTLTPAFSMIALLISSTLRPWYQGNW